MVNPISSLGKAYKALRATTSRTKLGMTSALLLTTAMVGVGLGDVLTNKVSDYRREVSNTEMFFAKYTPLIATPLMLLLNGCIALMNGMNWRGMYIPMGLAAFYKALKHDMPLLDTGRRVHVIDKVLNACKKRVNSIPLEPEDLKGLQEALQAQIITPEQYQVLSSGNMLPEKAKEPLYQLYADLDQERYDLINEGAEHNGKRGWFGQVYSFLIGLTWFTVLHEMLKARYGHKMKPIRGKHKSMRDFWKGGEKDPKSPTGYKDGHEPFGTMFWHNLKQEVKAPYYVVKDLGKMITKPSLLIDGFRKGKDPVVEAGLKDALAATNKKRAKQGLAPKKEMSNFYRYLIALSAGTPALAFNLACLFGRSGGAVASGLWVNKYGTGIYNMNSPYYTEDQYQEDLKNKTEDPSLYALWQGGEGVLAGSRYLAAFSHLSQAFNPASVGLYGGMPYSFGMTASALSYSLSGALGSYSPVAGQAFTILGTALGQLAYYGGPMLKEVSKARAA